jgi:hypothetical protein
MDQSRGKVRPHLRLPGRLGPARPPPAAAASLGGDHALAALAITLSYHADALVRLLPLLSSDNRVPSPDRATTTFLKELWMPRGGLVQVFCLFLLIF